VQLVDKEPSGFRVILDDGTTISADVVLVAAGSVPAVSWLTGNGFDLTNGVRCDEACLVAGGEGRIAAAGDVAYWPHLGYWGIPMRIEHWSNALEQGAAAARAVLNPAGAKPFAPVMSCWSDQFGHKLQVVGAPGLATRSEIAAGELTSGKFVVSCWKGDRLVAAIGMGMPGQFAAFRTRIGQEISAALGTRH
jgi:NADPH-dependent 2,4-dienoyl-CoA reductase/sulfur reductase-like enzyme